MEKISIFVGYKVLIIVEQNLSVLSEPYKWLINKFKKNYAS